MNTAQKGKVRVFARRKARHLVEKYYAEVVYGSASDYSEKMLRVFKIKAKTCALTVVDDVLLTLNRIEYTSEIADEIDYWQEIKQEIENL